MSIPPIESKVITDRLLSSWIRCKRKAWLDVYENKERKIWLAHRSLQLDHQYKSLKAFSCTKPGYGIKGCLKGEENVVGIRLKTSNFFNHHIEAHPLILHKTKGNSCFGNFKYQPVIVRQGRRITRNHRLSLALWGHLLEQFQQSSIDEGLAISLTKNGLEIDKVFLSKKLHQQLLNSINKLIIDLDKKDPPSLTSDRKKCVLCPWNKVCNKKALEEGHLSEINGIGSKRQEILQSIGINNVTELAKAKSIFLSDKLDTFGGKNDMLSHQLINQAKVQLSSIPKRINTNPVLPELSNVPGVIIYDIESDPDANHDFLHGFISIRKTGIRNWDVDNFNYNNILTISNKDEKDTLFEIHKQFNNFNSWPILHYGETEYLSFQKMAKRHGMTDLELNSIQNRFVDVHERVRKHWLLPVNSYGLKGVAQWLGFKWDQKNVDGAQALLWWRQWRSTQNNSIVHKANLKKLLRYNQDDCIATWVIAQWLLNNDREHK